jgi:hypothetical protein
MNGPTVKKLIVKSKLDPDSLLDVDIVDFEALLFQLKERVIEAKGYKVHIMRIQINNSIYFIITSLQISRVKEMLSRLSSIFVNHLS